ncbi:MAG: hypothetical protein GY749_43385 [Desulfobacteraceae bacterium]|nr:hypothetical protein [Desulfobacteraceae bacterium]
MDTFRNRVFRKNPVSLSPEIRREQRGDEFKKCCSSYNIFYGAPPFAQTGGKGAQTPCSCDTGILQKYDFSTPFLVHDPLADPKEAEKEYGLNLSTMDNAAGVDAVIVAVMHEEYKKLGLSEIAGLCKKEGPALVVDVKGAFSPAEAKEKGIEYWRL